MWLRRWLIVLSSYVLTAFGELRSRTGLTSDQAWRMLTRSFMKSDSRPILAYSPMFHARLFKETGGFRAQHFQPTRTTAEGEQVPFLDGNLAFDRPLFVQFCANNPDDFLEAARHVAPYCDAVDLNLGCPQGIARKGHYGAFLQEDWDLIYRLINKLHTELPIPVTAKFRILETKEKTLEYAKMILSAGASIITVHGRRREQKGHNTGLADWSYIRYLRDNLPPDTVIFANGNILNHDDLERCLEETGADGVMSAEGNLSDPSIFAEPPPAGSEGREYWRGRTGHGGYRMDAVSENRCTSHPTRSRLRKSLRRALSKPSKKPRSRQRRSKRKTRR